METLCSLSHERLDGTAVVFDFVVGRDAANWYRHEYDLMGHPESVGPTAVEEIRNVLSDADPTEFVMQMRAAASTLETAGRGLLDVATQAARDGELDVADVLAGRAADVQRERLRALDQVMLACEDAWDAAVDRVEWARDFDAQGLPSALRAVELLWSARSAVRASLGAPSGELSEH
jgi:hypothetical protein